MAKPWARIEIGYLSHPKFLALNANAICLWHEGKNYCDTHQTDGMIPADALKTFRFRGKKSIEILLKSCGKKPDNTDYFPLWERHELGFKMHDYLDHNDCREAVLARMGMAVERRNSERERKAEWRRRKQDLDTLSRQMSRGTNDGTATSPSRSTTETPTETETEREKEHAAPPRHTRQPTLVSKRRLDAAWEGPRGLYVHQKQHRQFVDLRNGNADALFAFYNAVADAYTTGSRQTHEPGADMFKFWSARYDEKWPATPAEKPAASGVPPSRNAKESPYARTGTEGA